MKIIAGLFSLANLKSYLTKRSLSPNHLLTKSDELIEKKVPSASVAQALAKYDFPVPGGPYSKIPLHGFLSPVNNYGNFVGKITASCKEPFACSRPATSVHFTLGFSRIIAEESAF